MPCRVQSEVKLAIWPSETCPVQAHRWTPKIVLIIGVMLLPVLMQCDCISKIDHIHDTGKAYSWTTDVSKGIRKLSTYVIAIEVMNRALREHSIVCGLLDMGNVRYG